MAKKKEMDKLAHDAAAALAAGMSYGQWKALHPKTDAAELKDEEIPYGWKMCKYCGKYFRPTKGGQRYCEFQCQRDAQRIRDRDNKRKQAEKKRTEERNKEHESCT
jgi:hypothetical protein